MLFPVPIQMAGGPDPPPEEEVATFFWVDDRGEIAKTIESVPIRNGVAVYNGEPLPHGAHWAITIHDVGGLPIFRSGPLAQLPGPASDFTLGSQIRVFRLSSGAFFGIDSPDGAPELVRQRLNSLPEPFRVDGVKFSADDPVPVPARISATLRRCSIRQLSKALPARSTRPSHRSPRSSLRFLEQAFRRRSYRRPRSRQS
jgi:hypothetical protein